MLCHECLMKGMARSAVALCRFRYVGFMQSIHNGALQATGNCATILLPPQTCGPSETSSGRGGRVRQASTGQGLERGRG